MMSKKDNYSEKQTDNKRIIPAIGENLQGKHPNSLKALKEHQFKAGSSGNPTGAKPSYKKLKKILQEIGDEQVTEYNSPDVCSDDYLLGNKGELKEIGTRKQVVLRRIWDDAQSGDMQKIQLLIYLNIFD
jgi:hypothetical protein